MRAKQKLTRQILRSSRGVNKLAVENNKTKKLILIVTESKVAWSKILLDYSFKFFFLSIF